jgi:hypothetical protein
MSFDQAEQFIVQQAAREAQMREARKGTAAPLGGFSSALPSLTERPRALHVIETEAAVHFALARRA